MPEDRLGDVELHALPGERDSGPVSRYIATQDQAEEDAQDDGTGEEAAIGQRFAYLEVGDLAGDLDRADGAVHDQQVAREPGRGDGHAGQVEHELQQVDVGEELPCCRRDGEPPPAIREGGSRPAPREQDEGEDSSRGEGAPHAAGHD